MVTYFQQARGDRYRDEPRGAADHDAARQRQRPHLPALLLDFVWSVDGDQAHFPLRRTAAERIQPSWLLQRRVDRPTTSSCWSWTLTGGTTADRPEQHRERGCDRDALLRPKIVANQPDCTTTGPTATGCSLRCHSSGRGVGSSRPPKNSRRAAHVRPGFRCPLTPTRHGDP